MIGLPGLTPDRILPLLCKKGTSNAFVDIDDRVTVTLLTRIATHWHLNILMFDLNGVEHCQNGNILVMSDDLNARRHKSFVERRNAFDIYIGYIGFGPSRQFVELKPLWD
jgi:hypothetical protein